MSKIIDIDKYLDQTIVVKFRGKTLHVKQPSARQNLEIIKLEEQAENKLAARCEIAHLIMNNNKDRIEITLEEIREIPFKVQNKIIEAVSEMKLEADNDPN